MAELPRQYQHNRHAQLRAFCLAVQLGSISKAAEKLDLAQPTVSLQIQALEQELGELLLERRGPKISPTPAGLALFELALPLVQGMDSLPQALADKFGNSTAARSTSPAVNPHCCISCRPTCASSHRPIPASI